MNFSLNSLSNCKAYDEDGKCLGEVADSEEVTEGELASRCSGFIRRCSKGYKRDRNNRCRKVIKFRFGLF